VHQNTVVMKYSPCTVIQDGDMITIDASKRVVDIEISEDEFKARRAAWKAPPLKATSGTLYKYTKLVTSASEGCVTDA
jgi:dihydroxy-acid dehydratase